MDTLTSPKVNNNLGSVNRYYFKDNVSNVERQKHTVIKYTKLPDFSVDGQVSGHPRFRRYVSVEGPGIGTSRSMDHRFPTISQNMLTRTTNRKIVNITQDDDDSHSRLEKHKSPLHGETKLSFNKEKQKNKANVPKQNTSRNYKHENSPSAKLLVVNEVQVNETSKLNTRNYLGNYKPQNEKKKRTDQNNVNTGKPKIRSNIENKSENIKVSCSKNSVKSNYNKNIIQKRSVENLTKTCKNSIEKELKEKSKQVAFIQLLIEEELLKKRADTPNKNTEIDRNVNCVDAITETNPLPESHDQSTETDYECKKARDYDSLDIPNVTLTKEKSDLLKQQHTLNIYDPSLPNLITPAVTMTSQENSRNVNDPIFYKSPSYIISKATVTYTTHQKINFHVMSSNDDSSHNFRSNPLVYPYSVVSMLKQEISSQTPKHFSTGNNIQIKDEVSLDLKEVQSFDNTCLLKKRKLMKPSDIISTINLNSSMFHNDYMWEQFQRELNFIDSFFESLQYLENCFLTEKCLDNCNSELWANNAALKHKDSDYNNMLSKLETNTSITGKETMASKSLYLLNLLIRDEQRRAKNLLLVLKMREDALKDFTKSQIIWLENKKKQENTDISTLKKKQRGALVKLQHECGEMQRMRKALLMLSEKRKAALMKTKKNIEVKLNNNVGVEQILLEKKKIKRSLTDRNVAPVKCFDLSSSGCDDSSNTKPKADVAICASKPCTLPSNENSSNQVIKSVEKSIQTGDSILESIDEATDTAEMNVVVDGGYLNILFQGHALPQIFSSGKQYEVNEEALRNIVNSSSQQKQILSDSNVFEKLVERVKDHHDTERSSSPSTARSLVDEFDQYYKDLAEEENYHVSDVASNHFCELKESLKPATEFADIDVDDCEVERNASYQSCSISKDDQLDCSNELYEAAVETIGSQAGPLPIPVGASPANEPADSSSWIPLIFTQPECSISNYVSDANGSISAGTSPVHEAEELRRQQLAIEREIKALEQQQCQLLVVREIPDKPPPPYTPPTESKLIKPPRLFQIDDNSKDRIERHITKQPITIDQSDAFDVFLNDYCAEVLNRQDLDVSDKPWDSCNLLPQKQEMSPQKLVKKACDDIQEINSGISPSNVSGFGRERRSDHIDDILFAEWRRCEPEWTALHSDEATVKNHIFDKIFQRILTESVNEYRSTVIKKTLNNVTVVDSVSPTR